jgi:Zn-finger nucleic acid-binding protein
MADATKDRLGDKLRDKERGQEDEYFARRDRELLEKLRASGGERDDDEETLRQLALMRCPKDGHALDSRRIQGVNAEHCPKCEGIWLDRGELEAIAGNDSGSWISRWLGGK